MKRNLYLKTVSVEEALKKYLIKLEEAGVVSLSHHANEEHLSIYSHIMDCHIEERMTAEPVFAKCCSPLFNASAMDGVAVKAADTKQAREGNPVRLKLGKDYKIVDTGDPIHVPFDAVIMAEDVVEIDDDTIEINQSVPGWNMVRPIGEDIVIGEMIIPSNHRIRPVDVGVMLASGNVEVKVRKNENIEGGTNRINGRDTDECEVISTYDCIKNDITDGIKVGIIPTGTEIIKPYDEPKEGDIIDSNSGMFAAQVTEHGAIPKRYDIVCDDYEKIKEAVLRALDENDMVITNAGSSAGTEDYTVHILRELGEVIVHGVAMKPGKPVILAIVNGKPVVGLPGYPVSAYLAFENFVTPVIALLREKFQTVRSAAEKPADCERKAEKDTTGKNEEAYRNIEENQDNESFRTDGINTNTKSDKTCETNKNTEANKTGETDKNTEADKERQIAELLDGLARTKEISATVSKRIVSSLKHREYVRVKVGKVGDRYICAPLSRGASAAMSLVRADGFLVIPQNSEGYDSGEEATVDLYNPIEQIDNTLVSIGSHDMMMDLINDMMGKKFPGMTLSSTHVGSMAGLMALSRGETTIAPTHLLNEEDGIYNISYLKRIFGTGISLIKGVDRIQGIMVKPGNPLGINSVEDIARTHARYVNRQRGAGTRVLLDYKMKLAGLSAEDINGYDKEAATHMAVAASVKGDDIDCGMGVKPAADAMGLDFVVIGPEEYDFAIKTKDLETDKVKAFISIITSEEFKSKLTEIGGYGFTHTGEIINL